MGRARIFRTDAGAALAMALLLWAGVPPESPVADAAMRGDVAEVRAPRGIKHYEIVRVRYV